MEKMKKKMMELWKDEEGATMVEYALMVALVAIVCITAIQLMTGALNGVWTRITTALTNA